MQAYRQRVEVKQHTHIPVHTAQNDLTVPIRGVLSADTLANAQAAIQEQVALAPAFVSGLQNLWGDQPADPAAPRPLVTTMWVGGEIRNLTHIQEGHAHNHRIGRTINVNGITLMITGNTLMTREPEQSLFDAAAMSGRTRLPQSWHLFVVQEYQVPADDATLDLATFMRTFFELSSCKNAMQALIADKNRYTADATGKVLLHKVFNISERYPTFTRRVSLRFPKPVVVKYKGASGSHIAENRISAYLVPCCPVTTTNYVTVASPVLVNGEQKAVGYINCELGMASFGSTVYFTDP